MKNGVGVQENKKRGRGSRLLCLLLSLLGALFLLWYIRSAAADVASTDYIRLINAYLPDTLNPEKFFTKDILTRIPITYLMRTVNLWLFGYSVTFDRVLGVIGLFLSALVVMRYGERMRLPLHLRLLLLLVLYSLNKWEMLLNGSGYAHFLAFVLFYLHFLLLERWYQGTADRRMLPLIGLLPYVSLLTAGPYVLVYTVCLLCFYGWCLWTGNKNVPRRACLFQAGSAFFCLFLYLLSNHYAVYEYAGAQDIGLTTVLTAYPAFSVHFLLNGLASLLLSGELLEELLGRGSITMQQIYLLGAFVGASYLYAFFLYFRRGLYRKTVFPMLLLLYGVGSHLTVFLSRYVFLRETYAWQSRYALQYQSGILGILLVYGLVLQQGRERKREVTREKESAKTRSGKGKRENGAGAEVLSKLLILLTCVAFLWGNCYTSVAELRKMPYREQSYERMIEAARNLSSYEDAELETIFEYRHGGERIRAAYGILEENHLNIYR